MTFIWPALLILLLTVPVLVMLYLSLQRRRAQVAARYGNLSGMASLAPDKQVDLRRHVPPVLFMLAIGVMIVALARPQTVVSLPRLQGTVILAFDVSGSMKADDLKPTRMDAAKAAAKAFIEKQPTSVSVGVVAFSDSGLAVQQPSIDKQATLDAIDRLTPQRGTSLANGIFASLTAIEVATRPAQPRYYTNATPEPTPSPTPVAPGEHLPAVIVLLTDGENTVNPDPMLAVQAAVERGVRIYTVGIGSPQGADLHIEGFVIHSQLDEAMLNQISGMTGGEYYNADTTERLLEIYSTLGQQLIVKPEETEITSLFAGASILILLTAATISFLWFGRML